MAEIVPTILATTPQEYQERLDLVTQTSKRVHVDITDGSFVPSRTISLAQVHVPEGVELDLHLMVSDPMSHLESALALKPSLIIVHAEAEGDHNHCIDKIQSFGVKAGVAYLAGSQPDDLVKAADHVLIFTGKLGHNGGTLDPDQLPKLAVAKDLNPNVETSVDGGVTIDNADSIQAEILYVGAGYEELIKQ